MKLALGTAQFGMDYGINNQRGKIPQAEVFQILDEAKKNGIETLDTAYAYGDSEKIIGEYLQSRKSSFQVVSKLPPCDAAQIGYIFHETLKRLQRDNLYGYLLHSIETTPEDAKKLTILSRLKSEGKIQKIGVSLYYPEELSFFIEKNISIDLVQIPYNIFDQRFGALLPALKDSKIEVHVRSVFLQGLFFMRPQALKGNFVKIKHKLETLGALSKTMDMPISALCLNFAVSHERIDKVIVGVDNLDHLRNNLESLEYQDKMNRVYDTLVNLKEDDERIILPFHWQA